jgi:hypothetical protein
MSTVLGHAPPFRLALQYPTGPSVGLFNVSLNAAGWQLNPIDQLLRTPRGELHAARFGAWGCTRGVLLGFTPLLRLKPSHACGRLHASRGVAFLTGCLP